MEMIRAIKPKLWAFLLISGLVLPLPSLHAEEKEAPVDIGNMAIPESLGKIEERFQGTSKRWVINIQDVHAHFGAQENIAAIIDHLNGVYGLRLVAYEGGWNVTSYPKTWEIQSSRQKQLVLRTLLEEDLITGPAFAAMNSKTPIVLHGVEDPEIYKKNLWIYLKFIENKESIEKEIQAYQDSLEGKKLELYNPELLDFDRQLLKFREDAKTADKFLPQLLNLAKTLALDLTGLTQMQLFVQVSAIEKSIDKNKLKGEIERLMQEHKNSRLSFEEMLRHGKLTDEKLSFYPNAQKQRELLKLHDGIVHDQLFAEIDKTVLMVKEKLFKNDAEKELDKAFERFVTAKKIMTFKATPADFKLYQASKALMLEEMTAAKLDNDLKRGAAFYSFAEKRNEVFFNKISSAPELSSEDIALVAGGFHTEGMRELLRGAGVSYIVITPDLGQESPNEARYFQQLRELKVLTQTLSSLGNRLSDQQDKEIAAGERAFESGQQPDIRKVVAAVAAAGRTPVKKDSAQNFLTLPKEEQLRAVEKAVQSVISGDLSVSVIVRADALKKILASSQLGEAFLKAVIANPANHLTVLYRSFADVPDIISDAFGSDNVRPFGEMDINRAIARLPAAEKTNALAVISDEYQNPDVLVLKELPLALLLFRPMLENGWLFAWDDPAAQDLIAGLAQEILSQKGFLASA